MSILKCSCCDATVAGEDIYDAVSKAAVDGWIPSAFLADGTEIDEVCGECCDSRFVPDAAYGDYVEKKGS